MYPDGKDILIIDSDRARRELSERVLATEGFRTTAVSDEFSAIRAAGSQRFALAIAAMQLPGTLGGSAMLQVIRARQPWIKVLFTGDACRRPALPDPDREDFIASPYRRRELLGCVFELLQRESRSARSRSGRKASCDPFGDRMGDGAGTPASALTPPAGNGGRQAPGR